MKLSTFTGTILAVLFGFAACVGVIVPSIFENRRVNIESDRATRARLEEMFITRGKDFAKLKADLEAVNDLNTAYRVEMQKRERDGK